MSRPKMVHGPAVGSCGHPIEEGRIAARCLPCASQVRDQHHRKRNGNLQRRATLMAAAAT